MSETKETPTVSTRIPTGAKIAIGLLALSTTILGFLYAKRDLECSRLNIIGQLQDRQIQLMQDECREYQYQLTNKPTFEEGYQAALLKRNAGTYLDGYKDAQTVFDGSNNYAQGYHAAITQFGYLKDIAKESAAKIAGEDKDKKAASESY